MKNAPRETLRAQKSNEFMSSSIQTILSVSELHRFNANALADFTAGRESHPALRNYELMKTLPYLPVLVKAIALWYD